MLTDAGAVADAIHSVGTPDLRKALDGGGWALDAASLRMGPFGLSAKRPDDAPPASEVAKLKKIARDLKRANGGRAPTVVFLIDEAQAELTEALDAPARYVRALHKGEAGLKALVVYGGLGDTPQALGECGVTRPGRHMNFLLRRLDGAVVKDVAGEALGALTGQSADRLDPWSDAVVAYAQGWPAHLSHVLLAVCEQAGPNIWHLDTNGFDAAMKKAVGQRAAYYGDRLKRCARLSPSQYGKWAAMAKAHRPLHAGHVADTLGLRTGEAHQMIADAVAAGLLEPIQRSNMYLSPIPSLLDHIEVEGWTHDQPAHRALPPGR